MNILLSAQHFGFGPMAELLAIESAIKQDSRGISLKMFLHDVPPLRPLLDKTRSGRMAMVPKLEHPMSLVERLADGNLPIDAILSSYDSEAVFAGWFCRRPVFFYDGIPWLWNWEDYHHRVKDELQHLYHIRQAGDPTEMHKAYHRLVATDYHFTILLSYHLATMVYARKVGKEARFLQYPEFLDKTRSVGTVVDPDIHAINQNVREHILVSLSGSLAPLLSFEQNMSFARGALMFAIEAFESCEGSFPWIFCCHPQIVAQLAAEGHLSKCPKGLSVVPSFDSKHNLHMIKTARALFTSPGFLSVQEAAHFHTPVFLLPEQNGGQPRQFLMLRESGYDSVYNWTVTGQLYGGKCVIGEYDVDLLYQGIEELWSSRMSTQRRNLLCQFLKTVSNEKTRAALVKQQVSGAHLVFGGIDGSRQIASHFLEVLGVVA